jgi:hypothetical protein
VPRSRTRAETSRSRRPASALLSATLSLAAALAFAAPLAHVHLEAADALARDLCGEHLPAGAQAPGGDVCSICLAGGHAIGAIDRTAPEIGAPVLATSVEPARPPVDLSAPQGLPGAPRAPPFPG